VALLFGCARKPAAPPAPPVAPPTEAGALPDWCEVSFSRVAAGNLAQAQADPESIDRQLVKHLAAARRSIDAALHELDNNRLTAALIDAHRRGVRVRVVTETDYRDEVSIGDLEQAGILVKDDQGRPGLMHNKFLVIDGEAVWTGSFNTTDNCAYKNNNNAILIRSREVAANFAAEFHEMFERGQFGRSSDRSLRYPVVKMSDGTEIVTLFSPENDVAEAIIQEIGRARQSIRFLAFSFTHDGIAEAMLKKMREGVTVQGVFETRGSDTPYSEYARFRKAGLDVHQDGNPYNMHHKVLLIDDETVITGSFNFSRNAAETNEENVVLLRGNRALAATYEEEFQRVYRAAGGLQPAVRVAARPRENSSVAEPPPRPSPARREGAQPRADRRVNVNTATVEELATLPGIGGELAQRIIAERPYGKVDDLLRVNGIGQGKLKQLRGRVKVR
jgi:competence ComEA-like helix-hairpin-helix protein